MTHYPNGISNFEKIRLGDFIYVDKTQYIARMLESRGTYFFLGRPRRFGKSLFTSTLEAFFLGKSLLFKGLAIESYEWKWEEYPVIHLDFASKSYSEKHDLFDQLNLRLAEYEAKYGIQNNERDIQDIQGRFLKLIKAAYNLTGKEVVVLVDEYEKPVVDNLDNAEVMEYNRVKLEGFYSVLKSLDSKLKFVFLTGVTKFGQMSVFSGLNNIKDISLLPQYSAICGITEEELLSNFHEGINGIAQDEETDFSGAVALLKENYDGYHFSEDSPDIYNPFSIVNAMENHRIAPYWATSGPPTVLAKTLIRRKFSLQNLNGVYATQARLMGVNNLLEDPIALLYHTGYLTIKDYIKKLKTYILRYPNKEVEGALFDYLLPVYSKSEGIDDNTVITDMGFAFYQGKPEKAMSVLKSFTAAFTYDVLDKIKIEQHFEDVMYILFRALLPYVSEVTTEERTSEGRSDIVIKTNDYIYIIELKIDASAEEALQQIKEKQYALPYLHDPRITFLIGINFSTSQRRINDYKIETTNQKQ